MALQDIRSVEPSDASQCNIPDLTLCETMELASKHGVAESECYCTLQ